MFGVFLTPPSQPDYDAGLIWIDGTQYSHMCGHGTIAVSMAMVARGMVTKGDIDRTVVRFETTAGAVVSEVAHDEDRVLWCRFENVPAYVAAQDITLDVPGLGQVTADIAWGGNYFGIIDLRGRGLEIEPANAGKLSSIGVAARDMLREKVRLQHPTLGHVTNLNFVTLWHEGRLPGALYKNVHVFSAGQLDRLVADLRDLTEGAHEIQYGLVPHGVHLQRNGWMMHVLFSPARWLAETPQQSGNYTRAAQHPPAFRPAEP